MDSIAYSFHFNFKNNDYHYLGFFFFFLREREREKFSLVNVGFNELMNIFQIPLWNHMRLLCYKPDIKAKIIITPCVLIKIGVGQL